MAPQPIFNPYMRDCPSRQALDRIGDRWTILIVGSLGEGVKRHKDLLQEVDGISQKMLAQTLRGLERDGLVKRTVRPVVPPHVEYELTDLGRTLSAPIAALERWAVEHMAQVQQAQQQYDAAQE